MNMHITAYPILQLETSKETLFCFIAILNITVTVGSPCFIPYNECEAASTLICYSCYHCHSRAGTLYKHLVLFVLVIVLFVLRFTDSDYAFGIFSSSYYMIEHDTSLIVITTS
jgi:hypothetical protein